MAQEKKDRFYVLGFRGFKKRENAPDFVLGSLLISIDEFKDFLDSTKVQSVMSEYQGKKQLNVNVLKTRDGGISFEVNDYKKDPALTKIADNKSESSQSVNFEQALMPTTDDLPF